MLCKIAGLFVKVPPTGDMAVRCEKYITQEKASADIVLDDTKYDLSRFPELNFDGATYMESCCHFYWKLPLFDGLMLHASAVEYDGKAYLFSGPSTVGKSTHANLWKDMLGNVTFLNDDKPALRRVDGAWYASGTPWCGKNGINENKTVPLAGICFLKQGSENKIRPLSPREAVIQVLFQSTKHIPDPAVVSRFLTLVDKLVREVPIYELENTPTRSAAELSFQTMHHGWKGE